MLAVIHSQWTFFAHSHSKRTFSKEEDGGRIQDNLEDKDMLENVGISSQKVINDMVTGQQCVVEAAIKETLSAIPGAKGADIKVIVINKMSGGTLISRQTISYVSYDFVYLYSFNLINGLYCNSLCVIIINRKFAALHASFSSSCKGLRTFIYRF